jgi:hypothetical protein
MGDTDNWAGDPTMHRHSSTGRMQITVTTIPRYLSVRTISSLTYLAKIPTSYRHRNYYHLLAASSLTSMGWNLLMNETTYVGVSMEMLSF